MALTETAVASNGSSNQQPGTPLPLILGHAPETYRDDSAQMDIAGVARRILGGHAALILMLILLGAAAGFLRGFLLPSTSSAVARVSVGGTPVSLAEATALADTARAIVTSPSVAARVLTSVGRVNGDPNALIRSVDVQALGSSAVVQLTVHDADPSAAIALANAFAAELVKARSESGGASTAAAAIDSQLRDLNAELTRVDSRLVSNSPEELISRRSNLVQEKVGLEGQRASLLATPYARSLPAVVDKATAAQPDLDPRLPYGVAGVLAGLILGLLAASLVEVFSPCLIGSRAVAETARARLLGHLRRPHNAEISGELASRLALAGQAAGVRHVFLLQAGRYIDLRPLAARLANANGGSLEVEVYSPAAYGAALAGSAAGLLLVAPDRLKKRALDPAAEVREMTGWPLLGVVTYKQRFVWSMPMVKSA